MTAEEAKNLKIGDRLKFESSNGTLTGKIREKNPSGRPDTFDIEWDGDGTSIHDVDMLMQRGTLLSMNRQKIAENLTKFLDEGFTQWPQEVKGHPIVYRVRYADGKMWGYEIYLVKEDTFPDTLGHNEREIAPPNSDGLRETINQAVQGFINAVLRQR